MRQLIGFGIACFGVGFVVGGFLAGRIWLALALKNDRLNVIRTRR